MTTPFLILVETGEGDAAGFRATTPRELLSDLDSALSNAITYCVNRYEDSVQPGWLEGMHYFHVRLGLLRGTAASLVWDDDNAVSRLDMADRGHHASVLLIDQLTSEGGLVFAFDLPDGRYRINAGVDTNIARHCPEGF